MAAVVGMESDKDRKMSGGERIRRKASVVWVRWSGHASRVGAGGWERGIPGGIQSFPYFYPLEDLGWEGIL